MQNILNMMNQYSSFIIIGLAIIILLLFIVVLVLLGAVNRLEKKYRKLMRGSNTKNLESLIIEKLADIEKSINNSEEALSKCEAIREDMKICVNKIAIMRYKAFEDVGSDLSFSIAILDDNNDGVLITGIYSRHDSTTYAKPIDKGISRYDLSDEENEVLKEAINK